MSHGNAFPNAFPDGARLDTLGFIMFHLILALQGSCSHMFMLQNSVFTRDASRNGKFQWQTPRIVGR